MAHATSKSLGALSGTIYSPSTSFLDGVGALFPSQRTSWTLAEICVSLVRVFRVSLDVSAGEDDGD